MDLESLKSLGLPEWLIIIAASLFILNQVGLLSFVTRWFEDKREHSQASENIAIEVLRDIIRESIQEHSHDITELDKSIYRLNRQVDGLAQSVRTQAGIISEKLNAKD